MLKVLLKKQIAEVFKSYFYDSKKNRMRSKWSIAGWIVLFLILMIGVMGGMFTMLAVTVCGPLVQAGVGWLYFLLMSSLTILIGAFGSVFNTYSGLYLAKDNDLLLSLPIPVRTIIASRLLNVYLMGTMYSAVAFLPALIVYWVVSGAGAAAVVCGLLQFLLLTVFVLILSCLLGWGVARLSLKLKNKSIVTVLIALVFMGAYYFFYFKANIFIRTLIQNAVSYGAKIRGGAYGLYLFGRIGEGDWAAAGIFLAVTAALFALVWGILARSFLNVATSSGSVEKRKYVEKTAREKSVFAALLGKEFDRFTSSANYMLNCGLGVLMIPVGGVLLLIYGLEIQGVMGELLAERPGAPAVLLCTMLCFLSSMNDMAAPSVSLEGKCLWIPQSLPVEPRTVLRAKTCVQLILTGIPMLFTGICAAVVMKATAGVKLLACALLLSHTVFSALGGMAIGIRIPLLTWTNELAPIKQSGAITLVLFGSWGICAALAGIYLLIGYRLGAVPYLLIWTCLFACASLGLWRWLDTVGARTFAEL